MSKNMSFSELYKTDFDLTDIFAMRQIWTRGALFYMNRPRKSNGLIYLNGCSGIYTDNCSNKLEAAMKSLVFLPQKSEYTVLNVDCGFADTDAYLIEFNMMTDGEEILISDKPFLLSTCAHHEITGLVMEIVRLYESSVRCYSAIKSKLFNLISIISASENSVNNDKYDSIRKGILMLEGNVYGNISISEVAKACNISETHFRRLFKEYAQKSPIRYRIELKIEYAKRLLTDTDMTVDGIAQTLCFESTSYFCRAFKNNTGFTPSAYRNV